ncbi:hypothetical protein pb186bvf_020100 [Paramecium bursaria]
MDILISASNQNFLFNKVLPILRIGCDKQVVYDPVTPPLTLSTYIYGQILFIIKISSINYEVFILSRQYKKLVPFQQFSSIVIKTVPNVGHQQRQDFQYLLFKIKILKNSYDQFLHYIEAFIKSQKISIKIMKIHGRNGKNAMALLSFGCWDEFGVSFQIILVSNEIQIHSSTESTINLKITLKLKMEIDNVCIEIKLNDHIYKASPKSILEFSHLVAAKVTYLGIKDNYQIVKQIGLGGQSEGVFEVQGIQSKEIKAMKQNLKSHCSIEKIHKEIKISQKFEGKNVIRIDEVYESERTVYIIYEKLKILKPQEYSLEQNTQFIYDLLCVLQIMHSVDYMHRDIKLSNIMVNSQSEIKLIDFGLATKCKKQHKQCGTPGHMAPEIFTSNQYNEKCDIYSLGILIYEMLTAKQLFIGLNKQDVKNKNQLGIFEITKMSQLSFEFQDLLKEMLQMDPNFRISAQIAKQSSLFAKDQNNSFMTDATSMHQMPLIQIQGHILIYFIFLDELDKYKYL